MTVFNPVLRLVAAVALASVATVAHATFQFDTGPTGTANNSTLAAQAYRDAMNGKSDSFTDLTIANIPPPLGISLNRTATTGPFPSDVTYTVSTQNNLYAIQSPVIGAAALSVDLNTDSLTFGNFGSPLGVFGFGASFYLSELTSSNAVAGTMSVKATDVNNLVQTFTFNQGSINNAATLYFRLGSTVALQSVELIAPTPGAANPNVFATVDNVVLAPVPTPGAWLMMLSGGAVLLRLNARRRG